MAKKFTVNFKFIQNTEILVFRRGNILVKIIPLISPSPDYDINNDIQRLSFFNEIKMQNYCYTIIPHICPKIYKYKIIYKDELKKFGITPLDETVSFGFITMEYIASPTFNPDNPELIYIKLRILLELALIGITHGDFHKNNFIFTGKPLYFKIIDFGQSHIIDTETQSRIETYISEHNYVEALKLLCHVKRFYPHKPIHGTNIFFRESIADAFNNPLEENVSKEMYDWVCNINNNNNYVNEYLTANPPIKHRVKNIQYYSPIFKIKEEECYYPIDDNLNINFANLIKRILLIVLIQGISTIEFIVNTLTFNSSPILHISQVLSVISDKSDTPLFFIYDNGPNINEETLSKEDKQNLRFLKEIPEIPNIEEDIREYKDKIEKLFTHLKQQALRKKIPPIVKEFFELKENTITLYNSKARLSDRRVNNSFRSDIESMLCIIYQKLIEMEDNYNFNTMISFFNRIKIKSCNKQSYNLSACEVLAYVINNNEKLYEKLNNSKEDKYTFSSFQETHIPRKNVFENYGVDPHINREIIVQFTDIPIHYPLNENKDITDFTNELLTDNTRKYVPHFSRLFRRTNGTRARLNNKSWGIFRKYGGTRKQKKYNYINMVEPLKMYFFNFKNRIKKDGVLTDNPSFKDYIKYMFYKIRIRIFLKLIKSNSEYNKEFFNTFVNNDLLHDEYFARMTIHKPCESEYRNLSACQVLKHYIDRKRRMSNVSKSISNYQPHVSFPVTIVFTPSEDNVVGEVVTDTMSQPSNNLTESNDNFMSFKDYKNSDKKNEDFVDNLLKINTPIFSRIFRDKNLKNRYRIDTDVIIGGTKHSRKKRRTRNRKGRSHKKF